MRRICVFCGSSPGAQPAYAEAARAMGRALVARGLGLVYGGGSVGLMGIVADAVLEAGGDVQGVIPDYLLKMEVGHDGCSELHVTGSMHERKRLMFELADGFVAMPGGLGTFEEIFEVLTWAQLGMHDKPCGLLDVAGYWQPVVAALDHAVAERFVRPQHRALLMAESSPEALLDAFAAHPPTEGGGEWIDQRT